MNYEEELFQKRLLELAKKADSRNIVTFTDFLNLNELNIYHQSAGALSFVKCVGFGGYEQAERQILAFIPDALCYFTEDFADRTDFSVALRQSVRYPISCLRIEPQNKKFSGSLSHRDFLGAALNTGIERSTIGDILVEENAAWMFCLERMADFLSEALTRVRNTPVNVRQVPPEKIDYAPKYELVRGSVASVRLDSLLALAFGASRSSLVGLIEGGKVFVNGRLITSNGYKVKENDLISARGLGRFRYLGVSSSTKKGRLIAEIEKYI
ncbi:S4 domain protein [Marvinbryantia formatexigens DSM 14469]|uniref:S4 domain protein n=1 Tax=Marvinbryantia formatexigens DSM 14469 TaxID=478749 RepID=C6LCA4_9FIRM|nr:YlmH/Sll1252 family protein [Marvinbryantia formatexigens]EET61568.1 S4 domain protein [Marvinbryantia formatexigens DSM 14469]UWO24601.1 YlmH/Sll1252 family protein [Marvinbryantia formatexigens DSM 14469]SDF15072.1 RNA-binding protein YlmH, contains S4-like domain [Marvinbryantia formatexigens]